MGLQVIRPRLQGSMMLRVTTMEILKLTYWDPARDMLSVLKVIFAYYCHVFIYFCHMTMEKDTKIRLIPGQVVLPRIFPISVHIRA